tara:strand:- start:6426 stop:8321 length:1896 start_codon:yes stop_codon:yes gene_type:complete
MAPTIGNLVLWISLLLAIAQLWISNRRLVYKSKLTEIIILTLLLSSFISFLTLIYSYIISDFSLINVFQNSHSSKPILYKISAAWGNHEGSMLLWILVLTIFNYFLFKVLYKTDLNFFSKTLETQGLIIFSFILFTILTSNPFEKIIPTPIDGLGFNPILQDPALAIHPPLLYVGYVGLSAAFSIGIAVLGADRSQNISWYKLMKPFVLISWSFLTIGIAVGSMWAYYELGWGGWWFWDPVENASFMPWLIATALLHSLIVVEKTKSLKLWVIFLSLIAFILSVLGTFLVRSGILTSVHAFALDPSRGIFILIFTTLLIVYSLSLFTLNSKKFSNNINFSLFSRENSILINNVLIIVVCASVFLGTIYPLLIEAFTNNKISVGEPYYNSVVIPIVIPAILLMGVGPILSWHETNNKIKILKEIFPIALITLVATLLFFVFYKTYNFIGILGIFLSFWIVLNNIFILIKKIKKNSLSMAISHLGIGLLILGITASSVLQDEKIMQMNYGETVKINKYTVKFIKINEISESNYVALQGIFDVSDDKNNIITKLKPENRFYPITNIFTTEASIYSNIFGDLYMVMGKGNVNDGWTLKLYYNPLVMWIWIGALIIFFGGGIAFIKNYKKIKYYKS